MTTDPRCYGFDEKGKAFDCPNEPGTPWSPYWCAECNERRLAHLDKRFAELARGVARDD